VISIVNDRLTKSTSEIEKAPALPVLGFHDPKVRIEAHLTGELLLGYRWLNPRFGMEPRKKPVVSFVQFALRCRSVERDEPVEPVDLDKNRASFRGAPAAKHGRGTVMRTSPDIGRHPKIGAQAHFLRLVLARDPAGCRSACLRSAAGNGVRGSGPPHFDP